MTASILAKRKFEVDDLFRFNFISEAQISPDGSKVVYILMRIDETQNKEFKNLWLIDLDRGTNNQVTFGDQIDFSPTWSPDSRSVAFLSDRGEKPQIYLLDIRTDETVFLAQLEQGCCGPLLWSPDGEKLLFTAKPPTPIDTTKPYRINRTIYRLDGAGLVENMIRQIYMLDLTIQKITQLTEGPCNNIPASWSPDGLHILMLTNHSPEAKTIDASLGVLDFGNRSRTILSSDWGRIDQAVWLNDGRIALIGVPAGNLEGVKNDLFVMNSDGSGIECRTGSLENPIDAGFHTDLPVDWASCPPPILASTDSSEVIICCQQGGELQLVRTALRGDEKIEAVAGGQRFCFPFNRAGDRIVFGYSTLFDPTQLAVLDLSTGEERKLTNINAAILAEIERPEVKKLHFTSMDGALVEGWLMIPPGEPPFPTVLHIHGGPHAAYGYTFFFDFLTLAGAGYAVLFINHRGSTGYGNNFATATHQDWGNLDYQDLMAGVDHAVELGIADPNRLGVCGVSGGGNLTCWIIGHTDRFKAAIPENPVTTFSSFYGTSDIGLKFAVKEMGGRPFDSPEVYSRCSPLTYAHRCKTPTLLVVGDCDYRCPPEQAEQFYTVLRANDCIAKMLRFPGGSHDGATSGDLSLRRMHNQALLEWFDRYLK